MRRERLRQRYGNERFYTGLILLLIGGAILLDRMGMRLPDWLYNWSTIIVLVGITSGIKAGFKGISWIIITAIGVVFMTGHISDDLEMKRYLWPALFIGIGVLFMLRPRKNTIPNPNNGTWERDSMSSSGTQTTIPTIVDNQAKEIPDEYIECTTVFGGITRTVTSKNFRGGEIVCFMGGAQISLTQADIQGPVMLEITCVFGGAKLVVPPNWEVKSEGVAVFAGIEDKRLLPPGSQFDPNKVLIITGTSVFGGIEIKSY